MPLTGISSWGVMITVRREKSEAAATRYLRHGTQRDLEPPAQAYPRFHPPKWWMVRPHYNPRLAIACFA